MRESAESGSPCDPVEISTTCSGGRASISRASTSKSAGTRKYPRSRATPMLRTIARPTKATLRWFCTATFALAFLHRQRVRLDAVLDQLGFDEGKGQVRAH